MINIFYRCCVFSITILIFSCSSSDCKFNLNNIKALNENDCVNFTKLFGNEFQLVLNNGEYLDTSNLILYQDCFFKFKKNDVKFLSKNSKRGEKINFALKDVNYSGIILNQYDVEGEIVHEFMIREFYSFLDNEPIDIVMFFSWGKGFIGSYLHDKDDAGRDLLISPCGNILDGTIDYSNRIYKKLL